MIKRIVKKFNFEIDNIKMVLIFVIHMIVTQSGIKGIFDIFNRKKNVLELSLNGSQKQLFTKMVGSLQYHKQGYMML